MVLSATELRITKHFVMSRIFIILIAVPFFKLFFSRFDFVEDRDFGFMGKLVGNFDVFDSVHFHHVASKGYSNEINHAFFPMFPFIVSKLTSLGSLKIVGFWLQMLLSYANTLLIYRLGKRVFSEHSKADWIA
jgi:Gpi18-like mannosyltransferase